MDQDYSEKLLDHHHGDHSPTQYRVEREPSSYKERDGSDEGSGSSGSSFGDDDSASPRKEDSPVQGPGLSRYNNNKRNKDPNRSYNPPSGPGGGDDGPRIHRSGHRKNRGDGKVQSQNQNLNDDQIVHTRDRTRDRGHSQHSHHSRPGGGLSDRDRSRSPERERDHRERERDRDRDYDVPQEIATDQLGRTYLKTRTSAESDDNGHSNIMGSLSDRDRGQNIIGSNTSADFQLHTLHRGDPSHSELNRAGATTGPGVPNVFDSPHGSPESVSIQGGKGVTNDHINKYDHDIDENDEKWDNSVFASAEKVRRAGLGRDNEPIPSEELGNVVHPRFGPSLSQPVTVNVSGRQIGSNSNLDDHYGIDQAGGNINGGPGGPSSNNYLGGVAGGQGKKTWQGNNYSQYHSTSSLIREGGGPSANQNYNSRVTSLSGNARAFLARRATEMGGAGGSKIKLHFDSDRDERGGANNGSSIIQSSVAFRKKKQERLRRRERSSGQVHAFCICEEIDIDVFNADWHARDVDVSADILNPQQDEDFPVNITHRFPNHPDVVVALDPQVSFLKVFGDRDCFIFRFGCIVTWGLSEEQAKEVCAFFRRYSIAIAKEAEQDDMFFTEERGPPSSGYIAKDCVTLATKSAFERLAYSYAFGQSVKLSVFEDAVERTIDRTKTIPEEMMRSGMLPTKMTNKQVSRYMGDLFVQRCRVNLHFDILDTPDVFWEFDEFEDHYVKCRKYLDLSKRVSIVNKRLEIMKELYDMLHNEENLEK